MRGGICSTGKGCQTFYLTDTDLINLVYINCVVHLLYETSAPVKYCIFIKKLIVDQCCCLCCFLSSSVVLVCVSGLT